MDAARSRTARLLTVVKLLNTEKQPVGRWRDLPGHG